jgi:predicted metal-dependent peptidase
MKMVRAALRLACASMPHLAGLAAAVRLQLDVRIPTAAITGTGRLLVNPNWFGTLNVRDQAFIMAHELFHLCLRSHDRAVGTDPEVFNWAHDYIINDMLKEQMQIPIPAGGLECDGARHLSAEELVRMIRDSKLPGPKRQPRSDLAIALSKAGLLGDHGAPSRGVGTGDVLSPEMEKELFPESDPQQDTRNQQRIKSAVTKSLSLGVLKDRLDKIEEKVRERTSDSGDFDSITGMLKSFYTPPWEMALQQWMEAVTPGPRSFARPSRRSGDRTDVVLPGRTREGWSLHIVLDTSGSMVSEIPRVLGTIASFCEAVNVSMIHVLQCDTAITHDDWLDPGQLSRYEVSGGGGSDMSPAMEHLANDAEVQAVVVITDGAISFPSEPMPYQTLWALTENYEFRPGYGVVLPIPRT